MVNVIFMGLLMTMIYGLRSVWTCMQFLNGTITAATRPDVYQEMYSDKFIQSIHKLHYALSAYCWSFIGGVTGTILVTITWTLLGTKTNIGDLLLGVMSTVIATAICLVYRSMVVPPWVWNFKRELTVVRGRLLIEQYNRRLSEVETVIAAIQQRINDDAILPNDADVLIRLGYERTRLLQVVENTNLSISEMSR